MNQGRIEQIGRPADIWERPASAFVAEFIGSTNRLVGHVRSGAGASGFTLEVAGSDMRIAVATDEPISVNSSVRAYVKIGDVQLSETRPNHQDNVWEGTVALESYQGEFALVKVDVGSVSLVSRQSGWAMRGARRIFVHIPSKAVRVFPESETVDSTVRSDV